jgi:hypothetical protein
VIQRISEPERIADAGAVATWQVQLNEAPSLEWRPGVFRSRMADLPTRRFVHLDRRAGLVFALERTTLRMDSTNFGMWIVGANRKVDTRLPDTMLVVAISQWSMDRRLDRRPERSAFRAKLPSQAVSPP